MHRCILIVLAISTSSCMSSINSRYVKCKINISLPGVSISRMQVIDQAGHRRTINNITAMQYVTGRCQ